jgi:ribosome modulation factor
MTDGEQQNGIGHNSEALTDDQNQALFFSHKRAYEAALAKKKEAAAAFLKVCKLAKSELGDDAVLSIKDAILLDTDEGEAKLRADLERQLRIARWMNVPFGQQAELFSDANDRRPATERARAEGKKAGMEGLAMKPPYHTALPQFDQWVEGWHEGQAAIFAITKPKDAEASASAV